MDESVLDDAMDGVEIVGVYRDLLTSNDLAYNMPNQDYMCVEEVGVYRDLSTSSDLAYNMPNQDYMDVDDEAVPVSAQVETSTSQVDTFADEMEIDSSHPILAVSPTGSENVIAAGESVCHPVSD